MKPDRQNPHDAAHLLRELQHNEALQHQPVAPATLDRSLILLRGWQSQRLAGTYADLLADPSSSPALRFFLSDLYAPHDFSQRDHDVERIHAFLARVLPPQTIQLLTDVIELNLLTNTLDQDLCHVLVDQLGVTDMITPELYAEAYRICNNYAVRVHQIELLTRVLLDVGAGARLPIVNLALTLARIPAQRAGWGELYDFLKRGYAAFRKLRDVAAFVAVITQRERHILDQIYAGDPALPSIDDTGGDSAEGDNTT